MSLRHAFDEARPDFPPGMPLWDDASFDALVALCPRLGAMRSHLADRFSAHDEIQALASSYKDHAYGAFMYALARALRPTTCVELGVFQGFSLLSVAAALRDNGRGTIVGIDLFEGYRYRHESLQRADANIDGCGLRAQAVLRRADAFAAHEGFSRVDWLHVDLSNDGDTVRRMFSLWEARVSQVILFEGGSPERDRVDWMASFHKPAIAPAVEALRREYPAWRFAVLAPYPSMTVAIRLHAGS